MYEATGVVRHVKLIQLADKYRILKLNSDLIADELSDGLKLYSCFQIIIFFLIFRKKKSKLN